MLYTALGALVSIPVIYVLLAIDAGQLRLLSALFVGLCVLILREGFKGWPVRRDMAIAMLIIFAFNVLFWCFFSRRQLVQLRPRTSSTATSAAGSSGGLVPVSQLAGHHHAPLVAWIWVKMSKANPPSSSARASSSMAAFLLLMFAPIWSIRRA